jgi:maltose phosphorylase
LKKIIKEDEWKIIKEGFNDGDCLLVESIFSLSNGYMGGRGNFEEGYGGNTLRSFFHAGVYYPDKPKYGWHKIGYPEVNNKIINSTDVIGIKISINGCKLDLAKNNFKDFRMTLNMKNGLLERSFVIVDDSKRETAVNAKRFISAHNKNLLVISYNVTPLNYDGKLEFEPYMNGLVECDDMQGEEKILWEEVSKDNNTLVVKTKKTGFHLATSMEVKVYEDNLPEDISFEPVMGDYYVGHNFKMDLTKGKTIKIEKYVSCYNSQDTREAEVAARSKENLAIVTGYCFNDLLTLSEKVWSKRWDRIDVGIDGDAGLQQSVRYNLFVLNSTFTGEDGNLNISPKGFSGEKYSGSTYWDTEIFCFPYYLYTKPEVARNLLIYRYNHLQNAIENAKLLGLKGALYPMITMDGREGHAEWEITLMEIHRNSAIAYAIYNYIRSTDDLDYMADYGFEVVANVARFWADRVTYKKDRDIYVILGVTGPDEFHNNVNNNWYTNFMAKWALDYAYKQAVWLKSYNEEKYKGVCSKYSFTEEEFKNWNIISKKIYLNENKRLGIFEQFDSYLETEDAFLDKEKTEISLPIVQSWSWDRINRSNALKQADVILGMCLFSDIFGTREKKRNFDFYEPKTTHESSLSACIYSIIASEVGYRHKAYNLFRRASRLDLDDYNNDSIDGLHVTSMGGAWMSVVMGFAGLSIRNGIICLRPVIPEKWVGLSFKIAVKGRYFNLNITRDKFYIHLESGNEIDIEVSGKKHKISPGKLLEINI